MARNNNAAEAKPEVELPKGMRLITADVDGWYKPEVSGNVHGKLVSMEERQDQKGVYFYVVQLLKPLKAMTRGKEEVMLDAGQMLGVGEKKALERLRRYVTGHCEIFIAPIEKVQSRRDATRSFWRFKIASTGQEGPLPALLSPQHPSPDEADDLDDIPFG